eukprot:CAMPEP_0119065704 /NCGR_PEP_ID=MMETSP1178-20130426/8452_1 /TAXON_ID=33656 /ORGANISM="unid sp, Strain CCMP2000" /LENGTH=521 /DNA_ID=CAMNT_0007047239 /DNA_START=70 /DNA_END=1635 /DNA_ORIENTATION=+
MPPKKSVKQATAATQQLPSVTATKTFIARLARQQLEQLLQESVTSGEAPTLAEIKDLLPLNLQTQEVKKVSVAGGNERQGTGLFDGLDIELLLEILRHAGLKQRVHSAMAVCKAWRQLTSHQELFTSLELCPRGDRYGALQGKLNISDSRLLPFVQWLPKKGVEVERLSLDTGDKYSNLSPDVTKKLLSKLTSLTHLELGGKKVTAALLTVAAKQPFASRLTSFSLGYSAAKVSDTMPLLLKASQLTELRLNFGLGCSEELFEHFLHTLVRGWSEARGGGGAAPLLTKLDMSGYFMMKWSALVSVSRLFPELEELTVSGVDITGASLAPLEVLPRLRKLHIGRFVLFSSHHMNTGDMGRAFRAFFALAPCLEHLSLSHGKMWYSREDRKSGKPMPPLPGCDGALELLPTSLRCLSLSTMVLNDDDKLALAQLPQLRALSLSECGADALRIATELCQLSPQLSPSRVLHDNKPLALPLAGAAEASTSCRDSSRPPSASGSDDMGGDHAHDSVATAADESDED